MRTCRLGLAAALACSLAAPGCAPPPGQTPAPGVPEYQRRALVPVPGGLVNAAGGNLIVERLDLSLDTLLGTQEIRAVYNAASGAWLWSFQIAYDGAGFLDPTGAWHDVSGLAGGEAIPGTIWVIVDGDTLRTKGGLAHHFDAAGRLDHVAWATADHPRIQYTWTAQGVELASCASAAACLPFYAIALDAGGDPVAIDDPRGGRTADFAYDAQGRLVEARDAEAVARDGPGWRYEYAPDDTLLTAVTSPADVRIEYGYGAERRLRSVTSIGEGDPVHGFHFHALGGGRYAALHANPLGGFTRYVVDGERRLLERERGGERTTWTWQGRRPATRTLPDGATTGFGWSGDDLVSVTQPSGNVVDITPAPGALAPLDPSRSAAARVEDALGLVEERTHDALGRPVAFTNGAGETTEVTYNAGWGVASLTDAAGSLRSFPLYGIHGHWLAMEGDASDERLFDVVGNARVPSLSAQPGGALVRAWDAHRRLVSLGVAGTREDGGLGSEDAVAIERRADGLVTAVRRPGGGDHELVYDALGRPSERRERVDGVWRVTRFEHDAAGHLVARTRPNGMREEWDRDAFGRIVAHRALRDGVLEAEASYTWRDGRLESAWDSVRGGSEAYAYDAAGRVETTLFAGGEQETRLWDARSRLVRETLRLPGGQIAFDVGYAYDGADRRIRIVDHLTGAVLVEREFAFGRLAETRYANGLVRTPAWDAAGAIAGFTTRDAAGQEVETTAVETTVELAPPRVQVRSLTSTALATSEERYWLPPGSGFASPEQLVGKRVFGWSDGEGALRRYAYDELSNRTSDSDGDVFTYNPERNRLVSAALPGAGAPLDYAYDEAGFVTARGGEAVGWTATGRLASFGASSAAWDLRGRLVSLDFPGVAAEFRFGGRVPADAGTGALGALDLGEVVLAPGGGAARYRHRDFRGHVGFVSDPDGAVVTQYRYGPYAVDAVFGEVSDSVRFDAAPELGPFVLLGARVYDPAVGRFLSPDPFPQLANQFVYTNGNPVAFTDASGRFEITRQERNAILGALAVTAAVVAAAPASGGIIVAGVSLKVFAEALAYTFAATIAFDNLTTTFELREPARSPSGPSPSFSPSPQGPDAGPAGPEGAGQQKVVEMTLQPPPPTAAPEPACSPSMLGRLPDTSRALRVLFIVNVLAAAAWLGARARRRLRTSDDARRHRAEERA